MEMFKTRTTLRMSNECSHFEKDFISNKMNDYRKFAIFANK